MSTTPQVILDSILQQYNDQSSTEDLSSNFNFFTAEQILKDFDLSYDELELGITDGGGDGGVDGIYLLVNGNLVQEDMSSYPKKDVVVDLIIFQATTHAGFQEKPVERFNTISTDLFDFSRRKPSTRVYNTQLVDAIQRFRNLYKSIVPYRPRLNVCFYYASRGVSVPDSVEYKAQILESTVNQLMSQAKFSFKFLDAAELCALYDKQPRTTYDLQLSEILSTSGQLGLVCLVELPNFFKFVSDKNGELQRQLFETNVRDYQGHTQVNDEIYNTLKDKTSEDFWWLNNGISILAASALQSGKILTIENPQIVNGLQTSTEIYKYCKTHMEPDETRKVLVRVMVPATDESRDRIIKATNSQTVVPLSSLRATNEIQKNIEVCLGREGLFYDRRKNYYKNQGKPRDKIVGIPNLAQAVMAIVLRQPNRARARPSSLLKKDADYKKMFSSDYPIELYYVCIEGMRRIESHLRPSKLFDTPTDRNNLKFYVAMHVIAGVSNPPPTPEKIAKFDLNSIDKDTVLQSLDLIKEKYIELGGSDKVAKGPRLIKAILNEL